MPLYWTRWPTSARARLILPGLRNKIKYWMVELVYAEYTKHDDDILPIQFQTHPPENCVHDDWLFGILYVYGEI